MGLSCKENKKSFAELPPHEEGKYLYRGVYFGHPDYENAVQGKVVPGDVNGTVSPEEHNYGSNSANSPYTSWTRDPEIARKFAMKNDNLGVVLRTQVGAPPEGASWSWAWSPDEWGEQEVLLKGVREGLEVYKP
ncbi:hypothetical protein MSP8886_03147 [Marinomonas spartinae]|uniref:Uncharacterized protein n=1 Tax=Marinomonas spartinae TaxID=1792290 RepID=A0A1A8TND1_9GAMM|nr:hypothetical protein MSP8886_03147 [Marinomonas spartinae]